MRRSIDQLYGCSAGRRRFAAPIGEYDSSQPLNIGQIRWYGRIGLPIVRQLGERVPGRRTTLEFLPAVWFFGHNTDFVGHTLETDPLFAGPGRPADGRIHDLARARLASAHRGLEAAEERVTRRLTGGGFK